MTSKAGGRAPKVDARSAAQQAQQLSVEYDNFIQIDEAENSLDVSALSSKPRQLRAPQFCAFALLASLHCTPPGPGWCVSNPPPLKQLAAGQNNVEDPEEQEIQQVIEDKAAKPLITKQIKMVVRKQYKKLMSPTSKVMKDVVITNVQKDGSCDKKIGQLMQRV